MGWEPSVEKNLFFQVLDEAIKPVKKEKGEKSKTSRKLSKSKRQTSD